MKGKKKRNQQNKAGGMSSSSGSDLSDSSGSLILKRHSDRIKKKADDDQSPRHEALADSAYDGDNDSATAGSSPEKEISDPYALEMMEDVPVVLKKCQKKLKKATSSSKSLGKKALMSTHSPVPTSTPVLDPKSHRNKRRSMNKNSPSATPELTPILPVPSPSEELPSGSFNTPYNRRSTRKRPHQTETDTPLLPMNLSYSSQCDSGIVVSPLPKKQFILSATKDIASKKTKKRQHIITNSSKVKNIENMSVSFAKDVVNPDKKRKVLSLKSTVPNFKMNNSNDSAFSSPSDKKSDTCFGFDSLSPSTPPSSRKTKVSKGTPRKMFSSNKLEEYRLAKEFALSDSPGAKSDSQASKDSLDTQGQSPPMFSDEMFSAEADSMDVNRSSYQPYKISKIARIKKANKPVKKSTKGDEWASNFNMEIADIEKFELNIE